MIDSLERTRYYKSEVIIWAMSSGRNSRELVLYSGVNNSFILTGWKVDYVGKNVNALIVLKFKVFYCFISLLH